ncbi:hypothetical protein BDZ91DRAFT_711357 [Kalaharituber pfeilii]|nr:hypothetical protein BDZ91DRAFT_711357 [Kalaharituber pfeilii]
MQQGSNSVDGREESRWGTIRRSIGGYVYGNGSNSPEGRFGGGRRQKLAEYVRAANEFRQAYYSPNSSASTSRTEITNRAHDESAYDDELMEYVANGKEEIVLFPSYGRKRIKVHNFQSGLKGIQGHTGLGLHERDIVADVDIKGWIYTPHTAFPPSRKNRVVMAMMAKLCGLPAIPHSNDSPSLIQENKAQGYAEEAAQILAAHPPATPTPPQGFNGTYSPLGSAASKLSWIGSKFSAQPSTAPQASGQSLSREDIEHLHKSMHARLSPFLTTPAFHMPLTVFLYNDKDAQSTTLRTDNQGHFAVRKPLPFFPTHVRVLAGETLCAEEEIRYIDPDNGISIISDIDDTIKISGVGSGLREMFRNVFTRDISTLPVPGVAEWFNSLAAPPLNIQVHYLSNSPWQLFPFLRELLIDYMKLPKGTWHLKKYSGFVQGIFEPVIERKRESLEGLMRDFPGRKWILVGDGGEGDLEVYTDVVKKWPGKVIAVYIRDVSGIGEKVVGTGVGQDNPNQFFSANTNTTFHHSRDAPRAQTEKTNNGFWEFHANTHPPNDFQSRNDTASFGHGAADTPKKIPPPRPPKPTQLRSNSVSRANDGDDNLIDLYNAIPSHPTSTPDRTFSLYDGHEYGTPSPPRSPRQPYRRPTNTAPGASSVYINILASDINTSSQSLNSEYIQQPKLLDKKAELWKKRWEYADQVLAEQGILLRSWKVGDDVRAECVALAKAYLGL